jgi:hypothetical protein
MTDHEQAEAVQAMLAGQGWCQFSRHWTDSYINADVWGFDSQLTCNECLEVFMEDRGSSVIEFQSARRDKFASERGGPTG